MLPPFKIRPVKIEADKAWTTTQILELWTSHQCWVSDLTRRSTHQIPTRNYFRWLRLAQLKVTARLMNAVVVNSNQLFKVCRTKLQCWRTSATSWSRSSLTNHQKLVIILRVVSRDSARDLEPLLVTRIIWLMHQSNRLKVKDILRILMIKCLDNL